MTAGRPDDAFLSPGELALLDELLGEAGIGDRPGGPGASGLRARGLTTAPLTPSQRRLWFLHELDPASSAYHVPFALELRGPLDVAALRGALDAVVRRHTILRTTFGRDADDAPVQRAGPVRPVHLPITDLPAADDPSGDAAVHAWLAGTAARPFDIREGPLLRAALGRRGAEHHVLSLTVHHLVFDGWSVPVLVEDLGTGYRACRRGDPDPRPEPEVQYADYAAWVAGDRDPDHAEAELDYWAGQLAGVPDLLPLPLDHPRPAEPGTRGDRCPIALDGELGTGIARLAADSGATVFMVVLAAFQVLLARCTGVPDVAVGTPVAGRDGTGADDRLRDMVGCFINTLVLRADLSDEPDFATHLGRVRETVLAGLEHRNTPFEHVVERLRHGRDLSHTPLFTCMLVYNNVRRTPIELDGLVVRPIEVHPNTAKFDLELDLWDDPDGPRGWLEYSTDLFEPATAVRLVSGLRTLLTAAVADPGLPVTTMPLLDPAQRHRVLVELADGGPVTAGSSIATLIADRAGRNPRSPVVVDGEVTVTFAELAGRAHAVAGRLRALGAGPGDVVGICVDRSADLIVAMVGVLFSGAAYLPLDPDHPRTRLGYVLADARPVAVLRDGSGRRALGGLTGDRPALDVDAVTDPAPPVPDPGPGTLADPAYVIYTSGSTGAPKGVVVEHRQLAAFVAAMDARLGTRPGCWLATTSTAFDISILELLWTLARGFRVVLHPGRDEDLLPAPGRRTASLDLGLFYFAADDDGAPGPARYRLLTEGARFADRNGFSAVWTPERHFHSFGGLYPNPSVPAAALAATTERIAIRAGSVVLPLHNPVRVAEEWAVVDNLSDGRVGLSFASGWHSDDFVLAPERYADRKQIMLDDLELVRRLWRGEPVRLRGGDGSEVDVAVRPRPVQAELPVWVTAAGSPETFEAAGAAGANVLTHLLGQNTDELAEKIARYRHARRRCAGGSADGQVTVMMHAFLGRDRDEVTRTVREPFLRYLRDSLGLVRLMASRTGQEVSPELLPDDELDVLLARSFERYRDTAALFGTVEDAAATAGRVAEAGADEIACLIDFGVDPDTVLARLPLLARLRERLHEPSGDGPADRSVAGLIERHGVTHLQGTPSLMRLLVEHPGTRAALDRLDVLLVGGEALPAPLARRLRAATGARLVNMYGPTETTIWSSTHELGTDVDGDTVPIGRPVGGTRCYVLDAHRNPVPIGVTGRLWIGGRGVARGYHDRPDLTAERFRPDPFDPSGSGRMYLTGDLARWTNGGELEYLGRIDDQVKVRGHRIELGEVEAVLSRAPGVRAAAATTVAGPDSAPVLVGHVQPADPTTYSAEQVRRHLAEHVPAHLVPSLLTEIDELPRTANGKVDRARLAAPALSPGTRPPAGDRERALLSGFAEVLGTDRLGVDDGFFDLGGDSIQGIRLVDRMGRQGWRVTLRALVRHQTVAALAPLLEPLGASTADHAEVSGPVGLTPVQRWLLDQALPRPGHYNHAMLLITPRRLDPVALAEAVRALLRHHDALRMRYDLTTRPPEQWIPAAGEIGDVPLETVPLAGVGDTELAGHVDAVTARLQASLDLTDGPLLRVALLDRGPEATGRLLVVVHHLVVDGISGRLLVEDLWSAYERAERDEAAGLPPKTSSFAQWARHLARHAAQTEVAAEAEYWLEVTAGPVPPLPRDLAGADPESSERHVAVALDRAGTERLLEPGGRTTVDGTILAALGATVAAWDGRNEVRVDLETHGRDHPFDDLDVSRTVGWFTAVHPVLMRVPDGGADPARWVEAADAALAGRPGNGSGYGLLRYLGPDDTLRDRLAAAPAAEIIVNYLGRFDGTLGPFRLAPEPVRHYRHPDAPRSHLLIINGYVADGRLTVDWGYSAAVHREETVTALATRFRDLLHDLSTGRT